MKKSTKKILFWLRFYWYRHKK